MILNKRKGHATASLSLPQEGRAMHLRLTGDCKIISSNFVFLELQ